MSRTKICFVRRTEVKKFYNNASSSWWIASLLRKIFGVALKNIGRPKGWTQCFYRTVVGKEKHGSFPGGKIFRGTLDKGPKTNTGVVDKQREGKR